MPDAGNHRPPYLHVEIAVDRVTIEDLPSNWRGWTIGTTGRAISPELPSTPEETVLLARAIVGRVFTEPNVPAGDVRRMLDVGVAQLDALAQDALQRLVLKT